MKDDTRFSKHNKININYIVNNIILYFQREWPLKKNLSKINLLFTINGWKLRKIWEFSKAKNSKLCDKYRLKQCNRPDNLARPFSDEVLLIGKAHATSPVNATDSINAKILGKRG